MRIIFISLFVIASVISSWSQVEDEGAGIVKPQDELLALLENGKHSSELYAQLGYSYYQQSDLAHAVLYYEKALKLAPRDQTIVDALVLIRDELSVQITEIPDFVLSRYYRSVSKLFSSTGWSIVQLIFGGILLALIYLRLFKPGAYNLSHRTSVALIVASTLFLIITILLTNTRKLHEKGQVSGIAMIEHGIYEAPDDRSELIVTIGPGNKVYLIDEIGEWYKVQLRDKDTGWIPKDQVKLI